MPKNLTSPPTDAATAALTIPVDVLVADVFRTANALNSRFRYTFTHHEPSEDELKECLEEPVAALPPRVAESLPELLLVFVPYLERTNGKKVSADLVTLSRPARPAALARLTLTAKGVAKGASDKEAIVFPFGDRDIGEYHYRFYQAVSTMVAERLPDVVLEAYLPLLRQELRSSVHGEVDELSWQTKIALVERQSKFHGSNKALKDYARLSFIDTMTLYLHGICCDLDVDTGPRQLASRHLRKRLELLEKLFPPPAGFAVFPDEPRATSA